MSLFKKYYQIFTESTAEDRYRKSKGLEPLEKLNPYEELQEYYDNRNIYISFRNIDKIGINPQSYHTDTPNAIYTYPLKLIWNDFDHRNKKIKVPYASEHSYIYVIRPVNPNKCLNLRKYSESDFQKDLEKIKNNKKFNLEKIDFYLNNINKKKIIKPGEKIWYLTQKLSTIKKDLKFNFWNRIFKDLDYDYILDSGDSIIDRGEPIQTLFLDSSKIKIVKVIYKKHHVKREDYNKGWSGVWKKDLWTNGVWKDGTWFGKIWKDGFWLKGIWKSGKWLDGIWRKGTWENGTWKGGIWEGGTWKDGTWEKGVWHNGIWENGTWEDGVWLGGTWLGGEWINGKDKNNQAHDEGDSPDKWNIK